MQQHPTTIDHVARWYAVEALVTHARDKGVTRIDTDLIAEALGLDETDTAPYVSRPLPPRDAVCARPGCGHSGADHHHGDTKCWAHLPRTRDEFGVMSPVRVCECPGFLAADDATESGDDGFGETPDEYRLSTKADTPSQDVSGQHAFEEEWMSEAAAKRRLPNCSVCKKPATDPAHDGDQSPETRHLRMLLNA